MMLAISKGFIKIAHRILDKDGKVIEESKGGFTFDREKGLLWVLIDLDKHEIIEGSFSLDTIVKKFMEYKEEK